LAFRQRMRGLTKINASIPSLSWQSHPRGEPNNFGIVFGFPRISEIQIL
jgi:hypothetical protein